MAGTRCYNAHARFQSRHGSIDISRLHCKEIGEEPVPSRARAAPGRFLKPFKAGTAPDVLARHGTDSGVFTQVILASQCRAGTALCGSVNAVLQKKFYSTLCCSWMVLEMVMMSA